MKISTKGRYAIRVMIDLAEHNTQEFIPLMDIAKRQEISEKYLEAIVVLLSKAGLVQSLRGKGGGYRLNKNPNEYTVAQILRITEGDFAPVACLEGEVNNCERIAECKTLKMWSGFQKVVEDYFEGITIEDLLKQSWGQDNYVI